MSKSEQERNRLQDEFDQIQSEISDFDISKHLARPEYLPDLGEIEIYDYDADLTVSSHQSMDVLESLVDLYLSDVPQLKDHPYIRNKMKEDATVYAEAESRGEDDDHQKRVAGGRGAKLAFDH